MRLHEKGAEFVAVSQEAFGDKLNDQLFLSWISKRLGFKILGYLRRKMKHWENNDFK